MDWKDNTLFTGYGERFRSHRRIFNTWLNKAASAAFHGDQEQQVRSMLGRLLNLNNGPVSSDIVEKQLYR
jgi:hypothetical protein